MTMTDYEQEPRFVDTFVVLDLDRTLLETDALVELLCMQLLNHGISREQIDADLLFIHRQKGASFKLLDFFEAQYGKGLFDIVKREILELAKNGELKEGLLCEGAPELIGKLGASSTPFCVLTYGEEHSQRFKLELVEQLFGQDEVQLHAVVTKETNKAAWIEKNWQHDESGRVVVPNDGYASSELRATTVVVIDDKLSNLKSGDDRIRGILVNNGNDRPKDSLSTADVAKLITHGVPLDEIAQVA
jgi:hypothetical protein